MFGGRENSLSDEAKKQFEIEWRRILGQFYNSPSVIVWTTFNDGWGQDDARNLVALTKELDPTRLVNRASGWTDEKVGDNIGHCRQAGPVPAAASESRRRTAITRRADRA